MTRRFEHCEEAWQVLMVQRYVFYLKTRNVSSKFSTFFHWEIGYNLRHEHISEDGNDNLWIVKPREKTNNLCNTPLLSIPKQILDKYKDNPTAWIKKLCCSFRAIRR